MSRAREVWTMIQVLLGGVFILAWVAIRESAIRGDLVSVNLTWVVIAVSLVLVVFIEGYLGMIP